MCIDCIDVDIDTDIYIYIYIYIYAVYIYIYIHSYIQVTCLQASPELRHVFDTFHPKEEAMRQGALEPTNCQRIARRLYQSFKGFFSLKEYRVTVAGYCRFRV